MAVSGTLGALLQGVSQQPAAIRNDGQVTEQINMVSDVVKGLTSRPATELVAYNTEATAGMTFRNVTIGGERFQIGCYEGGLEVIDAQGASREVTLDPNVSGYLGTSMEVYVYDDVIHLLNRDKVVAMDNDTSAAEADVVRDEGLVYCLGGEFGHTYTVNLEYKDGTVAVGTFTAPNGSGSTDAELTASSNIIAQLSSTLQAHGNFKGTTSVQVSGSVLRIYGDAGIKLTVTDGSGGELLRSQVNTVDSVEELSVFAVHGTLVRVVGADGSEDDYLLRFEIDGGTVGQGFGSDGVWREWFDPADASNFDLTTMPHAITKNGDTFTVSQGAWLGRRVGDSTTNKEPSFVGRTIRDINGFQSRLVFASGPAVVMTQTNSVTDFWKTSATVESDADPIDIQSTADTEFSLEWITPFDRDLIIFADFSQFIIRGGAALTPSNASIVQTTNFEMGDAARPASTGRTLLFPFSNGGYAGVKEFFSAAGTDASDAASITQVQDEYMSGKVTKMTASTNFSFVIVQTDAADESKTLFVHQYYYDGEEKAQAAWYKWEFPYDVVNVFFEGSRLAILMYDAALGYIQTTLDLDIPSNAQTGYHVTLDLLHTEEAIEPGAGYVLDDYVDADYAEAGTPLTAAESERTYVELSWDNAVFVQGTGCATPGRALEATKEAVDGYWRYHFSDASAPIGASVLVGQRYTSTVKPTMPFIRDKTGAAIKNSKLVVTDFHVYFEDSGYIDATLSSKYRAADRVHSNKQVLLDNDPDDPDGLGIRSGEFRVPWGERSDWSELTLSSDDVRPMTILEVEWIGQVLTRGRRL